MKECLKFYINGKWVDPVNPQHFDVINPATEESSNIPISTKSFDRIHIQQPVA